MLDITDVKVLGALTDAPLSSVDAIAKQAGMSPSGLLKRVRHLVESGFLNSQFVRAQISYSAVGLETVLVLAESKPSSWESVEQACDAHPYTQFRIRCMGVINGFLLIFAIPQNTKPLLLEFLEALKTSGAITKYSIQSPVSEWGHSETHFQIFDPANSSWNFDWKEWDSKIDAASSHLGLGGGSILNHLDEIDIRILRAFSVDARQEKKALAEKLGIRDYELSRRLKFLEENHAFRYHRLAHETGVLGVVMTVVLRCKANLELTGKVVNAAKDFPFQGSVYPLDDGFLILANMPSSQVTNMVGTMLRRCESVDLMWGDYNSSMKYFFDNDPSNFSSSGWNVERSYVVSAPLKGLQTQLQVKA